MFDGISAARKLALMKSRVRGKSNGRNVARGGRKRRGGTAPFALSERAVGFVQLSTRRRKTTTVSDHLIPQKTHPKLRRVFAVDA